MVHDKHLQIMNAQLGPGLFWGCLICVLPLTKAGHWTMVYLRETRVAVGWSAGGQPSDVTSFCVLLSVGVSSSEVGSVEEGSSVAFILISHRFHIVFPSYSHLFSLSILLKAVPIFHVNRVQDTFVSTSLSR
jgi:hypothetical protein